MRAARPAFRHGAVAIASLLLASASAFAAPSAPYDLILTGGRVIDPDSGRDEIADIGIRDGRIAAISTNPLSGGKRLDAKNMVVAPGFIDLHAHGQDPVAERLQLLDGVTTAIDMEIGTLPVADLHARMQGKALINFGASASHICARLQILSGKTCADSGPHQVAADPAMLAKGADPAQEARIADLMDRDVRAGALGYGLGIEYVPGAGRREIFRIFQAAGKTGAPVFTHVRSRPLDKASGVPIAVVQEVIADAATTGAPLQIVHIASTGLGDVPTLLELVKGAQVHGIDVTTEAYPYTAGSTAIGSSFFSEGWQQRNGVSYDAVQWPATGERLTPESFERYRRDQPDAAVIIHVIPSEIVDLAVTDPVVSIASDGVPWTTAGEHPRGAGTFARVLGVYVRDRKLLDLKTAIAKMTIMPARRLEKVSPQMARKGRIAVGADADITIFDPAKVKDSATFETPMQPSVGIRFVLVGGTLMARDGQVTEGQFPGQAIRSALGQP
ncbi:D-glutamate deacylase [Sphingobium lactosutens]|uniref:amidohydrolase family protein n=1 Tax=Sphingobium lactosutens TaxID=522773 RepID=UPI0015B82F72|nr:amidohydrolase family protein [Sphingobium lactosutens]NWK95886.1 D-glutamate deacylase [Sphingobium lactosutens]